MMSMTTELIDRLKYNADFLEKHSGETEEFVNDYREAADTIRLLSEKLHASQMERSSQYYNGGWIPVSERLPEDIKPVIVTWKNNNPESYYQHIVGKHFIGVAHYHKGKWYWYSSTTEDFLAEYGRYEGEEFDEAIEVIAWMPLPEPYKAESEE